MIIVYSVNNTPIRLTEERWRHIINRHPELREEKEKVLETITNPDCVQEGDFGEFLGIKFFDVTPFGSKFLVVAYKEIQKIDGFVITAYFTDKPSERRNIVWK